MSVQTGVCVGAVQQDCEERSRICYIHMEQGRLYPYAAVTQGGQVRTLLLKQMGAPAHPGHSGEFLPCLCLHRDCFTSGVWFNERDLPSLAVGWGTHWLSWEDWDAKPWGSRHLS